MTAQNVAELTAARDGRLSELGALDDEQRGRRNAYVEALRAGDATTALAIRAAAENYHVTRQAADARRILATIDLEQAWIDHLDTEIAAVRDTWAKAMATAHTAAKGRAAKDDHDPTADLAAERHGHARRLEQVTAELDAVAREFVTRSDPRWNVP